MPFIIRILQKSEIFSFYSEFEQNLQEFSDRISVDEESRSFSQEFISCGSVNMTLANQFVNQFPKFFSLPLEVKESHFVTAVVKLNSSVFCKSYRYALLKYRPPIRMYFIKQCLSEFMPFSGDINKYDLYLPLIRKVDIPKVTDRTVSWLYQNVGNLFINNGTLPNDYSNRSTAMLTTTEIILWRLAYDVASQGTEELLKVEKEYVQGLQLCKSALDRLSQQEGVSHERKTRVLG